MRIIAAATAHPEHPISQSESVELVARLMDLPEERREALRRLYAATTVRRRNLPVPPEKFKEIDGFTAANRLYLQHAPALARQASAAALAKAGLTPGDVDAIVMTTVTGVAVPSVDALLMNLLPFRHDVVRMPLFGLGCAGGAAAIARGAEWLTSRPTGTVLVVAVELCSLTFQRRDHAGAHLVATGLFGDGAAAVVLRGRDAPRPPRAATLTVEKMASKFYPSTLDVMGWEVGEGGFNLKLSPGVPDMAERVIAPDLLAFLGVCGVAPAEVASWIAHPGGPKVLTAMAAGLGIADSCFEHSRASLEDHGNMSSVSVLDVLGRTMAAGQHPTGAPAVMFAMGPGFAAEFLLLTWEAP